MAVIILTMSPDVMAAPAPGSPETGPVLTEGARCDRAPNPATRQGVQGKAVFLDFGKGKVYALTADGDEVMVFNNLMEMVEKMTPQTVVLDSLPYKLQNTVAELAKTGIVFLRLRDLKKVDEERKSNGVEKNDENDLKLLKTLYYQHPDLFQPLFTYSEELEVRGLTELWCMMATMRAASRYARATTNNPIVVKVTKNLRNSVDELSREIHEKALKLPLYKKAVKMLGLKGPMLAYIVSHDEIALVTLSRDALLRRYHLLPPYHKWNRRSKMLIKLANTIILHKHSKYQDIYTYYVERLKNERRKHWKAVFRVARKILIDLRRLAKEDGLQIPDT